MRLSGLTALTIFAAAQAAGCAASAESARPLPDWFVEKREALEAEGYPELANVPDRVDANANQAHWDRVVRDLDRAGAQVQANPRSEPPPTEAEQAAQADAFDEAARGAIESTRSQH
ncbi:MAG: hypothetical protein AB7O04_15165 [Hyphomonadaceae bacterium]